MRHERTNSSRSHRTPWTARGLLLAGGTLAAAGSLLLGLMPAPSSATPTIPVRTVTITTNNPSPAWVLPPGATVGAGYRVDKIDRASVQLSNATVTVPYSCTAKGSRVGDIVIGLPDASLSGSGWQPSGTPASIWQTAGQSVAAATASCGGGTVYVGQQAGETVFRADFTSTPGGDQLMAQFHIRQATPDQSPAGWSGVEKVITGENELPPVEQAVLSGSKASSPASGSSITPGQQVTYSITLSNSGTVAATGVSVSDVVDGNSTYVAGSASNSGTFASGKVTWSGLTVPAASGSTAGTVVLTFRVTVSATAASGTHVYNTGIFSDVHTPSCVAVTGAEGMCATNTTTLTVQKTNPPPVVTTSPVLSAGKSSSPAAGSTVSRGQTVTYTLSLVNTGNGPATGVTVTDVVPSGTVYVPGSASNGGTFASGTVTWSGLTVAAGGSLALTFRVTVGSTDTDGQVISNVGQVTNEHTPSCTSDMCPTNTVRLTVSVPAVAPSGSTTTTPPTTTVPVPVAGATAVPVPVAGATTVHTGMPWAGSGPYAAALLGFGGSLVGLGLRQRRRVRMQQR